MQFYESMNNSQNNSLDFNYLVQEQTAKAIANGIHWIYWMLIVSFFVTFISCWINSCLNIGIFIYHYGRKVCEIAAKVLTFIKINSQGGTISENTSARKGSVYSTGENESELYGGARRLSIDIGDQNENERVAKRIEKKIEKKFIANSKQHLIGMEKRFELCYKKYYQFSQNPMIEYHHKIMLAKKTYEIFRICLTGGACGGKTTLLSRLREKITSLDTKILMVSVPEAATMIFQAGGNLNLGEYTSEQKIHFQENLLKIQWNLEDSMLNFALENADPKKTEKIIIICDRGLNDGAAYVSESEWTQTLQNLKLTQRDVRDLRYDFVMHLVTAAIGAEDHLNFENQARVHENLEFMRMIDNNLKKVYQSHANYRYVSNENDNIPLETSSFEFKIRRCENYIFKHIGGLPINEDLYTLKYYLKRPISNSDLGESVVVNTFFVVSLPVLYDPKPSKSHNYQNLIIITAQSFLTDEYTEDPFYLPEKRNYSIRMIEINNKGQNVIKRKSLSPLEYYIHTKQRTSKLNDIFRVRKNFMIDGCYYHVDTYLNYGNALNTEQQNIKTHTYKKQLFSVLTVEVDIKNKSNPLPSKIQDLIEGKVEKPEELYFLVLEKESFKTNWDDMVKLAKDRKFHLQINSVLICVISFFLIIILKMQISINVVNINNELIQFTHAQNQQDKHSQDYFYFMEYLYRSFY